ncbi:MAG: hypothetical protein KC731_42930 [Myxococcales bacterium]|nr:hypothetical protein [Myxococcales bacterium]
MTSLAVQTAPVALEIHRLVRDLDPSRWRASLEEATRTRIAELEAKLRQVLSSEASDEPLGEQLAAVAGLLRERVPEPNLPEAVVDSAWDQFRKQLQSAYEDLRGRLKEREVKVPTLRPTNYMRSFLHALMCLGCVFLVEAVLSDSQRWLVPLVVAISFWSMEAARHYTVLGRRFLMWLFGPIAHPHEHHRVNSSTWLGTALVILGAVFAPIHCAVALGVLGIADPAAGLVGRRWGKTKLVGERSLEGTLAFIVAGTLVALAIIAIWHPELAWTARLAVAAGGATVGGLAELFSRRVDDNFSIPIATGTGAYLAGLLVGLG